MGRTGRLTSPADLHRTYAEGRRATAGAVIAYVRASGEDRPPRIGVTAARGLGGAVQRNRAKRRAREALRVVRDEVRRGVDVVVVAAEPATRARFQDLVHSLRGALSDAGGCR